MKCPKCSYLGFDTGDRCRNCGYDFSLMAPSPEDPVGNLSLRAAPVPSSAAVAALDIEPTLPPPSFRGAPALPLFGEAAADDEPLIKVPSRPRPPLSVRRTPDTPRLRAVARVAERTVEEPELDFNDPPAPAPVSPAEVSPSPAVMTPPAPLQACAPGRRLAAALIDHAVLGAIDLVVLYLTLRVAQLTVTEWRALPLLPFLAFLALFKLSYFTAFTCVGGQTIGKMAAGIRVVSDDRRPLDATHAVHRALAGAISCVTLGAGFVPALMSPDRRALHDRLAHTVVVLLPGA